MIVPAVSGESRARGAPGGERAARWFTLDRRSPGVGGVSAADAAVDALLPPVGHLAMHLQLHPFTRPPPAVVAGADSFGVFPGPLRNGVQWPSGPYLINICRPAVVLYVYAL